MYALDSLMLNSFHEYDRFIFRFAFLLIAKLIYFDMIAILITIAEMDSLSQGLKPPTNQHLYELLYS